MKLFELFDQAYPYEWIRHDGDWHIAEFTPDDGGYVAVEFTTAEDHEGKGGHWEIEFSRGNYAKGKSETTAISGEGDQYKIFATIGHIIKEFVDHTKPEEIFLTAREDSRMKLYQRLIPRLARAIGMKVVTRSSSAYVLRPIK